jgi:hypothetical protein
MQLHQVHHKKKGNIQRLSQNHPECLQVGPPVTDRIRNANGNFFHHHPVVSQQFNHLKANGIGN